MHNGSAVTLFWTIFVDEIEQNHAVLVYWSFVLNQYITFARAFDSWAHSRALNFCAPTDRDQETAFNYYKGSLQMWYIDLIQKTNKQVLHDFALFHQRK